MCKPGFQSSVQTFTELSKNAVKREIKKKKHKVPAFQPKHFRIARHT